MLPQERPMPRPMLACISPASILTRTASISSGVHLAPAGLFNGERSTTYFRPRSFFQLVFRSRGPLAVRGVPGRLSNSIR
mmetsp:Transcript_21904/g.71520  ORF Transcript_21904/g.71520 Transcript_21904/m.71520 type:complete len:80 (-) Transcript_21904:205-444(-)